MYMYILLQEGRGGVPVEGMCAFFHMEREAEGICKPKIGHAISETMIEEAPQYSHSEMRSFFCHLLLWLPK